MAQIEEDREDLLREATALRARIQLAVPSITEPVTCGFRQGDFLSIYYGQDLAYHFDSEGALRRAFVEGLLFRSQGTTLARLTRLRTAQETTLTRYDLTAPECGEFLGTMQQHLQILARGLVDPETQVRGQVPSESDLRPKLLSAVQRILGQSPHLAPPLKK